MILLCTWLAVATPAAVPAAPLAAPPLAEGVHALQTFEELVAEYEAAHTAWKDALRDAESIDERRALRDRRPAEIFAPRFESLAASGEGRAYLWQLDNLRRIGLFGSAREARRDAIYQRLFTDHLAAPWFGDALAALWEDRSRVDEEKLEAWIGKAIETNESTEVRAQGRYYLAAEAARSEVEAERERGFAALETLIEAFPDTAWADRARHDLFDLRDRAVGAMALDFQGTTVEGETFRLSDYRGKIVLLDFWGFW